MTRQKFEAVLVRPERPGSWTYFVVPFDVQELYGSKGQLKVKGQVNGVPFRSSLMPQGDGSHYMVVKKEIRDQAGVSRGDSVRVSLEPDLEPRTVTVPSELAEALEQSPTAKAHFKKLSYSHQKEYTDWVATAKREDTRLRRAEKAVLMLEQGKRLK